MRYVGLEHVEPKTMRLLGYDQADAFRSSSIRFSSGDVLYGRMRPYLNKVWVADFDGICSAEFIVFKKCHWLNSGFLAARINSDDFVRFAEERASGDRPRVAFSQLAQFEFLLPPLAEQNRIVAKLKSAMTRLRTGEDFLARGNRRIERYRRALLQSAATGELSKTWRTHQDNRGAQTGSALLRSLLDDRQDRWVEGRSGQRKTESGKNEEDKWRSRYKQPTAPEPAASVKLPESWTWASIDALSWASGYGTSIKCTYDATGPPVLRIPNIRERSLDFRDIKYATTPDLPESTFVHSGDMLLVRTNGSKNLVGRAAIIQEEQDRDYSFASYLIRYRLVGDDRLWSWISIAWDSDVVRLMLENKAKTTAGQYNLSLSNLSAIAIPFPPMDERAFLVARVGKSLVAADRLVDKLGEQIARSEAAKRSLLIEAFGGNLVEQDPGEGHASAIPRPSQGSQDVA